MNMSIQNSAKTRQLTFTLEGLLKNNLLWLISAFNVTYIQLLCLPMTFCPTMSKLSEQTAEDVFHLKEKLMYRTMNNPLFSGRRRQGIVQRMDISHKAIKMYGQKH